MMTDPFMAVAGWLQQNAVLPVMYRFGWMQWEDLAFGWALFAVYGLCQVIVTFAVCMPLEYLRPVERWGNARAVFTDVFYTVLSRVGLLPIVTFVGFYEVQVHVSGFLVDHGWVPPTLELLIPGLLGHQVVTFFLYILILDCADYWRHRLSHMIPWWWALHSLHHAQRQMTFWSDDRNHLLDDLISALWFGFIALLIGIPPFQFPLLVLVLRFVESLSHANARLSFGRLGECVVVSPRFHRAHHGVLAAGQTSCNYGAILPIWDIIFGTADFSRSYPRTGDPSAEEALATGTYTAQQWAGLRRMARSLGRRTRQRVVAGE